MGGWWWLGVSMEQKLAEFRARRQAEHAVKTGEEAGQRREQTAVGQGETTPTNGSEQTVEETETSRDSPQSSTTKVRHYFLITVYTTTNLRIKCAN